MKRRLSFSMFLLPLLALRSSGLSCGPEEYPLDQVKCCRYCAPGTEMRARCTANTDTLCEPCEEGSFNRIFTLWACQSCAICDHTDGLQQVKKCESTSDADCMCLPGYQPSSSEPSKQRCDPCPHGHFSKGWNKPCTPWTNCTATGRAVFRAGSKEDDAVCDKDPSAPPMTEFPAGRSSRREMARATLVTKPASTSSTLVASTALTTEGPGGGMKSPGYLLYILVAAALLLGLGVIILLKVFRKTKEPGRFLEQIYKDGKNSFRIPIQEEQIDTKSSLVRN
uniref:tumor necrosis factor receptor superfamily member 4 n=1 Tax=Euleptes europaea TaxID=460621 RepID=UPI0025417509|nr:tumor necrosis factor receptor superfamily member 4 [Euleptes europaea]